MTSSMAVVSPKRRAPRPCPLKGRRRTRCRPIAPPHCDALSPPTTGVYVVPTAKDVLRGRGGKTNTHPGNQRLLKTVSPLEEKYRTLKRGEKGRMSEDVVKIVRGWGGRFLDSKATDSNGNKLYFEMDIPSSIKLVEQKFRDDPKKRMDKRRKSGSGMVKKGMKGGKAGDHEVNAVAAAIKNVELEDDTAIEMDLESLDPVPSLVLSITELRVVEPPITDEPQSAPHAILETPIHCVSPIHYSLEDLHFELSPDEVPQMDDFDFGVNESPDLTDSSTWGTNLRQEPSDPSLIVDDDQWSDMFQVLFDVAA